MNRTKEIKTWENKVPSLVTQTWDLSSESFLFFLLSRLLLSSILFLTSFILFVFMVPLHNGSHSTRIMTCELEAWNTNHALPKNDRLLCYFPGKKMTSKDQGYLSSHELCRFNLFVYFWFVFFCSLFVFCTSTIVVVWWVVVCGLDGLGYLLPLSRFSGTLGSLLKDVRLCSHQFVLIVHVREREKIPKSVK